MAVILLRNLAIGHAISQWRDYITIDDVKITIKVALSSAPVRRVRILDLLLKSETGVLTTSQICSGLSISQPVVTRTMREFDALGIGDLSSVSQYSNSELQIKLNHEFDWFRTNEFLDLNGDFVPYEKKDDEYNDFDKQSVDDCNSIWDNNENRFDKNGDFENPISQNKDTLLPIEDIKPRNNDEDCHTSKYNLPPETLQKNNNGSSVLNYGSDNTLNLTEKQQKHTIQD